MLCKIELGEIMKRQHIMLPLPGKVRVGMNYFRRMNHKMPITTAASPRIRKILEFELKAVPMVVDGSPLPRVGEIITAAITKAMTPIDMANLGRISILNR